MKLKAIVLAACLIFISQQAHAQVVAFLYDFSTPLTESCAGGNPLPDNTTVDVMWDQNNNGPDDADDLIPLGVSPLPSLNQFQMNGEAIVGVPGGFATEPALSFADGITPDPPMLWLRICVDGQYWRSNVFEVFSGINDYVFGNEVGEIPLVCVDEPCAGCPSPTPVGGFTASSNSCSNISLNWNAYPADQGVDSLFITRIGTGQIAKVHRTVTSFVDNTVNPGISTYEIIARFNDGEQQCFSVASTTPGTRVQPPVAPADGSVSAASHPSECGKVIVRWTNPSDVSSIDSFIVYQDNIPVHRVERGTTGAARRDTISTPLSGSHNYRVSGWSVTCGAGALTIEVPATAFQPPAQVTGLTASTGLCSVNLSWTTVSGATGYIIRRNGSQIGTTTAPTVTFTDNSVAINTVTPYTVAAVINSNPPACQEGTPSLVANGSRIGAPNAPSNVVATDSAFCSHVEITWTDNSSDETGFIVRRDGGNIATLPAGTVSYNDPDATIGNHTYSVASTNTCGSSSFIVDAGSKKQSPNSVTGLAATNNLSDRVTLTWNNTIRETNFRIYRNGVPLDSVAADVLTYSDFTATPNTLYSYQVGAFNECGTGTLSASVQGQILAVQEGPENFVASDSICGQVDMTWDDTDAETRYRIIRNNVQIDSVNANVTTYTDITAVPEIVYSYLVRAVGAGGTGDSDPDDGGAYPTSGAPIFELDSVTCTHAYFSFTAGSYSDTTKFNVDGNYVSFNLNLSGTFEVQLDDDLVHNIYATSFNECGEGVSAPDFDVQRLGPPAGIQDLAGYSIDCQTIVVTWTSPEGATDFDVYLDGALQVSVAFWLDSLILSASVGDHEVYFVSTNECGIGETSNIVNVTVDAPPTAPVNVMASDTSCSGIYITWEAGTGDIDGYEVYKDGDQIASTDNSTFSVLHGPGDTDSHDFTVVAISETCPASDPSDPATGRMLESVGIPVITSTSERCDSVIICWSEASGDVDGYNIYEGGNLVGTTASNELCFGYIPSVHAAYSYTVTAFSEACGEGEPSEEGVAGYLASPVAPPDFVASTNRCDVVELSWGNQPENTASVVYHLYRDGLLLAGGDINGNLHIDNGATLGDHEYVLYAIPTNEGCDSSLAAMATGTILPYPEAPTNVVASDTSCSDVYVTWSASTGTFVGYIIYRAGVAIDSVDAATLEYTDSGIGSGVTAAYTVAAYDLECGDSPQSSSDDGTRLQGPEAPTNVVASTDNCDLITVSWTGSVGDVTEYQVYRGDELAGTVPVEATTFNDTPDAGTYEYTVRAFSEFCGLTNPSAAATGTRLPQMGQVTGVVASVDSCEGVYLNWDVYPGAVSYKIFRDDVFLMEVFEPSDEDFTVAMGEPHTYTVSAVNPCNEGPVSAGVVGVRAQTPSQVLNLTATQNIVNEVCLAWDDVDGELGYHIFRNGNLIATNSADDNAYCDQTAVPGVEYTYTVSAYNVCGEGEVSADAAGVAVFNLDAVTGVTATTMNCDDICLTWTDIDNETGYEILRDGNVITTVGADVTSYCDTEPAPGECATYTVRGFNEGGSGAESDAVEGCRRTIPGTVSDVAATTTDCDVVTITWSDITNEDNYQVWRDGSMIATLPANSVSYDDASAIPGQLYNYWVVAVNACGSGDVGNTDEGAIATVPGQVTELVASVDQCSQITLNWTDLLLETGYSIYRDGNTTTPIATVGANVVTYVDAGAIGAHTYQVRGTNLCGSGQLSEVANGLGFTVPGMATGVTAVENCGDVTLSWTAPATSPISSYNILRNGNQIASVEVGTTTYQDLNVAAGNYTYRIVTVNQCGAGAQSAASNSVTVIPDLVQITGFTAVASNCFCMDLSWNNVDNESGYYIYCNGTISDTLNANVTSTQFCPADTLTCLLQIAAYNGCEIGPLSTGISVTPNTFPVAVSGFAASENICDMVHLSWNAYAAPGVNYLRIRRNGTPLARVNASATTYNHPGIWPASTYSITALRVCAPGDTIESALASDDGRTAPTPVGPSQMAASDDGCGIVTVTFTFANVDGQDSVRIKRNGNLLTTMAGGIANVQRQYVDNNPLAQAATYEVCAVSILCGEGGCASDAGVAAPTAGTVTNLQASHDRCTSIVLTWTGTQFALNYQVRKNGNLVATIPQGTFTYTDNVTTGVAFNYTVNAANACGNGPQTPSVSGSTIPLPPVPTGFNASDGLCNVVIVSWNEILVATEYQVWRNNVQIATVPAGIETYNDTDIQPGVVYNYQVRGVNQCGLGTLTAVNTGSSAQPLPIVANVIASTNLNDRVHLSWNNVNGEAGFEILRGFPAEVIATVGANVLTYDDFAAVPGVEYEYRVRAYNDCGQGAESVVNYGYRVPVDPIPFGVVTVTTELFGCMSAVPADLDDDGDMDVVACGMFADKVMWYENMGGWQYVPHTIDENWDGARSVAVGDIDDDGDLDIAAVAQFADQLVWYRQNANGTFNRNVIASNYDGARDVLIADLDGDNDKDLVTAACDANDISWWSNNGSETFTRHIIDNSFVGARSIEVADLGNDGDLDILGAAYEGGMLATYLNNGSEVFTRNVLMSNSYGASYINAAHLNGDNILDIYFCVAQDALVAWWDGATMEQNYITSLVPFPREMDMVDMDDDGMVDMLLAANENQEISWWRHTEHRFYRNVMTTSMTQASVVHGSDFDEDGDTDVLGAGEGTIKLWISALTDGDMNASLAFTPPHDDEWPTYSQSVVPVNYELNANYPNPFNPTTQIQFGLPEAQNVQLTVYDITGREVARLVEGSFGAGYHTVTFDASALASGVYLYRIVAGSFVESRKMILMK